MKITLLVTSFNSLSQEIDGDENEPILISKN